MPFPGTTPPGRYVPLHVTPFGAHLELRDDKPVLVRLPELYFYNDGPGKPVGIDEHIGRRSIAAFGNTDGDMQMLRWATTGGDPARFGLVVHHTDG